MKSSKFSDVKKKMLSNPEVKEAYSDKLVNWYNSLDNKYFC